MHQAFQDYFSLETSDRTSARASSQFITIIKLNYLSAQLVRLGCLIILYSWLQICFFCIISLQMFVFFRSLATSVRTGTQDWPAKPQLYLHPSSLFTATEQHSICSSAATAPLCSTFPSLVNQTLSYLNSPTERAPHPSPAEDHELIPIPATSHLTKNCPSVSWRSKLKRKDKILKQPNSRPSTCWLELKMLPIKDMNRICDKGSPGQVQVRIIAEIQLLWLYRTWMVCNPFEIYICSFYEHLGH